MSRIPAATVSAIAAAEAAARFYARRHPGYTVAAQHPAYNNGIVVRNSYEIVFVRCAVSDGPAFADNDQTREQAEAQAVEWMTANAHRIPEGLRMRFDHLAIKRIGDGKAIIRRHINCFDEE